MLHNDIENRLHCFKKIQDQNAGRDKKKLLSFKGLATIAKNHES